MKTLFAICTAVVALSALDAHAIGSAAGQAGGAEGSGGYGDSNGGGSGGYAGWAEFGVVAGTHYFGSPPHYNMNTVYSYDPRGGITGQFDLRGFGPSKAANTSIGPQSGDPYGDRRTYSQQGFSWNQGDFPGRAANQNSPKGGGGGGGGGGKLSLDRSDDMFMEPYQNHDWGGGGWGGYDGNSSTDISNIP